MGGMHDFNSSFTISSIAPISKDLGSKLSTKINRPRDRLTAELC